MKPMSTANKFISRFQKASPFLIGLFFFYSSPVLQAQVEVKPEAVMDKKRRETLKQNAEILRFMENKGQLHYLLK